MLAEAEKRRDQKKARESVTEFARLVDIPTVPNGDDDDGEGAIETLRATLAQHHVLLLNALQDVADGKTPNLMVFMPPGSAKSTYVDVVFVPWFMARKAKQNVILASYGSDLARKQGRRARQLVRSESFQRLFDARLSDDSSAQDEWALSNGSEYMSGGILSGMTGNRADLLVIDDPVKGRAEADSDTIRKNIKAAWEDDLTTRLKPGGRQVIIQTRWHADDLSGTILPENWAGESGMIQGRDGRLWRVLCIPAEAVNADDPLGRAPGEFLWPEWFGPGHWAPFKSNQRTWSALYQQRPQPEEGTFFQRSYFGTWDKLPPVRHYGTSDYAVTDGGGDFTVHRIWGVAANGNIYRVDGWRGQTASDQWIERKIDLMAKYKPFAWFGESGVIQKAIEGALRRRMRERRVHCRLEWMPSITDKASRARGFQARASMGGTVFFEPGADLEEFLMFPAGRHDDEVDNASLIGRAVDQAHPAIAKPESANDDNPGDRWARLRKKTGGTTWQTA